jgi:hypothetical protein
MEKTMETEHKVPTLEELQKMSEEYGVKVRDGSHWFKAIGIVGGVISPDGKRGGHEREK